MGIKMSNMKGATSSTTVKWEDEEARVDYRPAAVTPNLIDEVIAAEDKGKAHQAITALLTQVLVSWEVVGEDGEPVPTSAESLSGMPLSFLFSIMEAIQEDMRPQGEALKPSRSG